MSSDRSMRIVLLVPESKAEDQLAVAVQDKILAVLPSEEDASSVSDSLFKLKELRQSSIGKKCSCGHQAFVGLVDELVACRFALWSDSLRRCGTIFHQNILNRVKFYPLVGLKDQDLKLQTSLGQTDTVRHRSDETQVRQTRREGEEFLGRRVAGRLGAGRQVASQRGRRSGVGWLGEGLPQNPLWRECS